MPSSIISSSLNPAPSRPTPITATDLYSWSMLLKTFPLPRVPVMLHLTYTQRNLQRVSSHFHL